jgi:Leucine rich repeat
MLCTTHDHLSQYFNSKMKSSLICLVSFLALATSLHLDCQFETTNWIGMYFSYTCHANISDLASGTTVLSYSGVHEPGKSALDVNAVKFGPEVTHNSCIDLTFIPQGLTNIFPNMTALIASECRIVELSGSELDEYVNLEFLAINNNRIERLPGRLFQSTPRLWYLNADFNRIEQVGDGIFDHLTNLTWARFFNNQCISRSVNGNRQEVLQLMPVQIALLGISSKEFARWKTWSKKSSGPTRLRIRNLTATRT